MKNKGWNFQVGSLLAYSSTRKQESSVTLKTNYTLLFVGPLIWTLTIRHQEQRNRDISPQASLWVIWLTAPVFGAQLPSVAMSSLVLTRVAVRTKLRPSLLFVVKWEYWNLSRRWWTRDLNKQLKHNDAGRKTNKVSWWVALFCFILPKRK